MTPRPSCACSRRSNSSASGSRTTARSCAGTCRRPTCETSPRAASRPCPTFWREGLRRGELVPLFEELRSSEARHQARHGRQRARRLATRCAARPRTRARDRGLLRRPAADDAAVRARHRRGRRVLDDLPQRHTQPQHPEDAEARRLPRAGGARQRDRRRSRPSPPCSPLAMPP